MLFCVTTRGRERIFSKPRDSAMVRTASICILRVALMKLRPLVGLVAGWLENRGIVVAVVAVGTEVPVIGYRGLRPKVPSGAAPAEFAPPTPLTPLPQPK